MQLLLHLCQLRQQRRVAVRVGHLFRLELVDAVLDGVDAVGQHVLQLRRRRRAQAVERQRVVRPAVLRDPVQVVDDGVHHRVHLLGRQRVPVEGAAAAAQHAGHEAGVPALLGAVHALPPGVQIVVHVDDAEVLLRRRVPRIPHRDRLRDGVHVRDGPRGPLLVGLSGGDVAQARDDAGGVDAGPHRGSEQEQQEHREHREHREQQATHLYIETGLYLKYC